MGATSTEEIFGPLLNVLAQSLDVREVFAQISALARQTVPHDRLVFGLISEDRERYRILAHSEDESRSEEHTSELQSLAYLVCRLLLEKKKKPEQVLPPTSERMQAEDSEALTCG